MTDRHHIVTGLNSEELISLGINGTAGLDPRLLDKETRSQKRQDFGRPTRFRGHNWDVGNRISEGMRLLHACEE